MAGSRKGERRGGAKPGHIRKSAAPPVPDPVKRKAGRPKGAKNKPKGLAADLNISKILARRTVADRELHLEMYRTITGASFRMPKEVLLDAMRYFEHNAVQYAEVLQANLQREAGAQTVEERQVFGDAVSAAEGQVDKYVAMAADVAFKAAPFFHAKLAALITAPGNEQTNQTLLQLLMRDLDEAGRPTRFIDHRPDETPGR